jgi:hypothetical protein
MRQKFPSLEGLGDSCARSKRAIGIGYDSEPAQTEGTFSQLEQELLQSLALDEFAAADVVAEGVPTE